MSDKGPIEQIKELAPQASLEVDLAVASHNAAVLRHKIVELEAKLDLAKAALEQWEIMFRSWHRPMAAIIRTTLAELKGKDT